MTAQLSSDAIEVGVVVRDPDRCLEFYRDVLGLTYIGDLDFGVARMWRFQAGTSVVKLLQFKEEPAASSPPGEVTATGYRYMSLFVSNSLIGWIGSFYERTSPAAFWTLHAAIASAGGILVALFGRRLSRALHGA